jgi:hypothetical protein
VNNKCNLWEMNLWMHQTWMMQHKGEKSMNNIKMQPNKLCKKTQSCSLPQTLTQPRVASVHNGDNHEHVQLFDEVFYTWQPWRSITLGYNLPRTNAFCHDFNIGLQPKQGFRKVRAESVTQDSHSHSQKCRRMWRNSPHTPKWVPTLGVGVLMDFQIFREQFQGSKLIGFKSSLYHCKAFET